jgi:hypothetical protein
MRLIKKGDKIHKSILTHVYFHRKSLKFLRIIHMNNSIHVYIFWKVWTKFIEKQGKNYDNKNKHLRRFHTKKNDKVPSKINLQRFVSDVPECNNTSTDASVSTMKTRSKSLPQIYWDYCIFCRQKAIKKDRKLKRIESSECVKYILNAARGKFEYDLLSLLTVDDVQEKAQYHSACITNYLLKWRKEHSADNYSTIKNESEHCGKVLERVFTVDTEASLLVLLHSGTSLTNRCKFILLV